MFATPASFAVNRTTSARSAAHSLDFLAKSSLAFPSAIRLLSKANAAIPLELSYEPGCYDIVCGRGKGSYNRPGNKLFRAIIASCVSDYSNAKTRLDKSAVLGGIVDKVQSLRDPRTGKCARFVMHSKQTGWVQIGKEAAREKVGHAMREAVMANDPSPSPAKDGPKSPMFSTGTHNTALS
jgi:hypothetical protein